MKCFILGFVFLSSIALGDVKFSITGVANDTKYGYFSGQSYTFNFVLNENYHRKRSNENFSINHWSQNTSSDPHIFNDITANSLVALSFLLVVKIQAIMNLALLRKMDIMKYGLLLM